MSQQINKIYQDVLNGKSLDEMTAAELQPIYETIEKLDTGEIRVAQKIDNKWVTNEWAKQSILLYFRLQKMRTMQAGDFTYFDKVPVKTWSEDQGVRVVPPAVVRKGAFINRGVILMPSYVNIGAYVDSGTMVDTWATVGSCAQIGKNVHLSGGVGIGGVLEPVQASPVIVEDHAFIGSRCIVVEGVVIEEGAVLGAGVTLTASTKIIDVSGSTAKEYKGLVPKNSVVIPGSQNKNFPAGSYGVPCALIIGQRKPSTDLKTSLTEALRDFQVSV